MAFSVSRPRLVLFVNRTFKPPSSSTSTTTSSTTFSIPQSSASSSNNNNSNKLLKSKYLLPKRIILIRHGESLGNVDETLYAEIPDWKIPLTRRGERQALKAAQDLQTLVQKETLFTYCSPYARTTETWDIMKNYLKTNKEMNNIHLLGTRQEPRIAEQQFGNFQNPRKVRTAKAERRMFGRFFFRFPNGEAGLDVYNRVTSFLATLSRDLHTFREYNVDMDDLNILIVTHGLTLRLFLMRYFQLSVEEFESSYNSQNAKLVVMDRIRIENYTTKNTTAATPPPLTDATDNAEETSNEEDDEQEGGFHEFFRLDEVAKEALNLKGDVSSEKPVYWRGDFLDSAPYDLE